jgi:Leucine-rich repeat (LRR) protein
MSLDSVWVFVDYQPITNGSLGAWTPAALATPATVTFATSGSATYPLTSPARGFYIHGNASGNFSATVTVSLTGINPAATFNWCAYASDYPPNATLGSNAYTLHGSTPFIINGSPLPAGVRTFTGDCISTLTDATGCPGLIPQRPTVSLTPSRDSICQTDTLTLTATATPTNLEYSFNSGPFTTNNTATFTPTATADHSVQVRNAAGCLSDLATTTVAVVIPPTLTLDLAPSAFCADSAFTITASGADSYCFSQTFTVAKRNPYFAGNDEGVSADCEYPPITCTPSSVATYTVRIPESGSVTVCIQALNTFGCASDSCFTIAVIPRPEARLISPPHTTNQSLHPGTPIDTIRYIFPAGACPTVTGLPTTITATCSNDTLTITGVPLATGAFSYTVTPAADQCPAIPATGTITITPEIFSFSQADASEIEFDIFVLGDYITVDWNDGTPIETIPTVAPTPDYIEYLEDMGVPFAPQIRMLSVLYSYATTQAHTVTASAGRWISIGASAQQITNIDVSRCAKLWELNISSNQLQSLNLTNNTELCKLSFLDNQINNINISRNPALTQLTCSSNQLTSLDISNNPLIERLDCADNQLQSLSLSNNTALTELFCFNNQLKHLNLDNHNKLSAIYCNDNQLETLSVAQCSALLSLDCNNNQLSSLAFPGCSAIRIIACDNNNLITLTLTDAPELVQLKCGNNNLTSVDFSNSPALFTLSIPDNNLIDLILSASTTVRSVDCSSNNLSDTALNALFTSLHSNTIYGGKPINVSNNPGVNTGVYDRTIATSKGWTVTP